MKSISFAFVLLSISLTLRGQSISQISLEEKHKIFNGKNFEGWYQVFDDKGDDKNLFSVEDGIIHVYSSQKASSLQSFAGLITENEYENYVLSFEYKWGDKKFKPREESVRDAGVLFHVFGENTIWPAGIECQIQEGDTGDLWIVKARASTTVNPMHKNFDVNGLLTTAGTIESEYNRFPRSFCWELQGWNKVVVVAKGDNAKFYINDKLVNEAINMKKWDAELQKWVPLTKGKILLQAEGSEVFYKNVTLQTLKN